jgi:hypothetical protein
VHTDARVSLSGCRTHQTHESPRHDHHDSSGGLLSATQCETSHVHS